MDTTDALKAQQDALALANERLKYLVAVQGAAAAAVPDLTKASRGTLTAGGSVVFSSALAADALREAAATVVDDVASVLRSDARILVTGDARLTDRESARLGLVARLQTLAELARQLLPGDDGSPFKTLGAGVGAAAALSAVAAALPGVLSLLSAHRTLSAQDLATDQGEALAAVAGALVADPDLRAVVTLDETRLLPPPDAGAAKPGVTTARAELAVESARLAAAIRAHKALPADQRDAEWLAGAEALAAVLRDVLVAIDVAPDGGVSPYARAVADESLDRGQLDGILVVRATRVSVAQLLDDRPLWWRDRVHTTGTAVLAYTLIDPGTSEVLCSGLATGNQELTGKLGSTIDQAPRPGLWQRLFSRPPKPEQDAAAPVPLPDSAGAPVAPSALPPGAPAAAPPPSGAVAPPPSTAIPAPPPPGIPAP